ncbi:MAG: hypothetical protein PVG99_02740 [Desulfobacteraceae bacterium]|jgi:fatty acid/phospholipid biosynthesis enzyme
MKIGMDTMNGDEALEVVDQGAYEAASKWGTVVILVGDGRVVADKVDSRPECFLHS